MVFFHSQNISADHPAVEILHDLETTSYCVDKKSSGYILRLVRCVIQTILKWANMLRSRLEMPVGSAVAQCVFFF